MIIDNNAEFWIGLNDGSFVSIHDAREVAETGSKDGTNYKIDYRRLFTPAEGSGEWLFFRLVSEAHPYEPVWLFVRLLDGDVDHLDSCTRELGVRPGAGHVVGEAAETGVELFEITDDR